MDQLPITLLSLINTVVEQYKEFSWSSQEQDGKIRINLTWTNEPQKRMKSKSSKVRDRKRYEQFLAQKQKVDKKNQQKDDNETSDEESSESENETDKEMDITESKNTPCDASVQVNILPARNRSMRRTINVVDNQPCKQVNNVNGVNKVKENITVNRTDTQNDVTNENKEKKQIPTWPRRFFRKIVMKTTGGRANTLIGQIPGRDYLIEHLISENETEIIATGDPEYRTYYKNLTEDFDDVKDTDFMDERVRNAIRLMEIYVEEIIIRRK